VEKADYVVPKYVSYSCTGLDRPQRLQEVHSPRIFSRHMKVARLSACALAAFIPEGRSLVLISIRDLVDSRAIVQPKGLGQ
jgi:hypothetical protein